MSYSYDIKKEPKREVREGFYLRITFMHGDADDYTTKEGYFASFEDMSPYLDFLDAYYTKLSWNSHSDYDKISELPNSALLLLSTDNLTDEEFENYNWDDDRVWDWDKFSDYNRLASIDTHSVVKYQDGLYYKLHIYREDGSLMATRYQGM